MRFLAITFLSVALSYAYGANADCYKVENVVCQTKDQGIEGIFTIKDKDGNVIYSGRASRFCISGGTPQAPVFNGNFTQDSIKDAKGKSQGELCGVYMYLLDTEPTGTFLDDKKCGEHHKPDQPCNL